MTEINRMIPDCPECGSAEEICGVQVQGVYDGVLFWECMVHGLKFHRWPEGNPYRARADRYFADHGIKPVS